RLVAAGVNDAGDQDRSAVTVLNFGGRPVLGFVSRWVLSFGGRRVLSFGGRRVLSFGGRSRTSRPSAGSRCCHRDSFHRRPAPVGGRPRRQPGPGRPGGGRAHVRRTERHVRREPKNYRCGTTGGTMLPPIGNTKPSQTGMGTARRLPRTRTRSGGAIGR